MVEEATVQVSIQFDWEEIGVVGLSGAEKLTMPVVPAEPGVYRFQIPNESDREVYIGETQDLRHRMLRNYANKHRGKTNVRVRTILLEHLANGRVISLAIVSRAYMAIDGQQTSVDMNLKVARLLVENAALAEARQTGATIHNL